MSLDQFTTAASDYAESVDRLFWLLVVISGLIVALIVALLVIFLARYRRDSQAPARRTSRARRPRDRDRMDSGDAVPVPVHVLVGGFQPACRAHAAEERARNSRRREAVDVAHPASERRPRDRRASRSGRYAGAPRHDVRRCDPRSLSAGAAAQAGHPAGPLYLFVVHRHQDRDLSI